MTKLEETKDVTPTEVMDAVVAMKETVKKYGEESHEYKNSMEKIEKTLDAQEKQNQELVKSLAEDRKLAEAQSDQIKTLELEIATKAQKTGVNFKETNEYKALQKFFQFGEAKMELDEIKALRTDVDTGAGYLTTTEFDTELLKDLSEISNMRSVSRIKIITDKSLTVPKRTGIPTVTNEGEGEAVGSSQSTYGSEILTPYRLSTSIPYTRDMLQTSVFDLENEIRGDANEAFAVKMGLDYVKGTGVKRSEGFTINAVVVAATSTSEAAGAISAKDLTDMTGELKAGYNPMYGFNRKSLAAFRSLEDGAGRPIWQISLAAGAPNAINGEPYIILPDMADIAAGSISVVYADFLRGYRIVDRAGLVIIRDEFALKKQAMIEMTFHRWTYGQVVLPEAIHIMTTHT